MRKNSRKEKQIKMLNKEILNHVISAVTFALLFIVLGVVLTYKYLESNVEKVYNDNGFNIQINPRVSKTLDLFSDIEGLNMENSNVVNITNNNSDEKGYQVLLTPINIEDDDIRLAIDNYLLRSLSDFDKNGDSYILTERYLPSNMTRTHIIKVWQNKKAQNKKINVDFKLEVKILN